MEELLNQIELSDSAIKIYINSIGRPPLSSFELYSVIPEETEETFKQAIKDLVDIGLFIPISPENSQSIMQYYAIPPFNPITKYYANINANLDNIKKQLTMLLANSLKKIFSEHKIIELDSIYDKMHSLRNDYQEDVIIQKQDVDDIVYGMENLKVVITIFEQFHQSIKNTTQTHFAELIKLIINMKTEIIEKIELLELKKYQNDVKFIIEQVFKDQFEQIIEDFIPDLHKKIETEFDHTIESLKNIVNSTFQLRNDFKMLLLNMLNNFESNFNKIFDNIKEKKENLPNDLKNFENTILTNFDLTIKNSVDSVTSLNHPIEKAMKNYFKHVSSKITLQFDKLTLVNSISRVNETIINLFINCQNDLILIVPKIEDHINMSDFEKISKGVKIKFVSSEPHTNSSVKKLKENKNLEYRTLLNDSVIILLGDNNQLVIGVIDKLKANSLQDFIGLNTNFFPFIKLIDPVITSIWSTASPDLSETPKSIGVTSSATEQGIKTDYKPIKSMITKITEKIEDEVEKKELKKVPTEITSKERKEILPTKKEEFSQKEPSLTEKFQQQIGFASKIVPQSGDTKSNDITTTFDILIQKLPNLTGESLSEELENIAELILEKKGFSVTLHKIRSKINQYKAQVSVLSQTDINHIIESINEWKTKIL